MIGLLFDFMRQLIQIGTFHSSIVAATALAIILLSILTPTHIFAADGNIEDPDLDAYIPILGNTATSDRELIKEINDLHVFDPNQPEVDSGVIKLEPQPQKNNIWDVIRAARRLPLTINSQVEQQKAEYIRQKMWISKLLERSAPYLQFIVSRLQARGLPLDLALLPAIESGFRPDATSPLRAAGLWQIVPPTASEIGLKYTTWVDGRLDLIQSTRAALDYLSYLNAEFNGDWELTLAAYNAGPGRVKSALRRNARKDIPGDFWSLRLPDETRAYLPKVAALLDLIHTPASPLNLPSISKDRILIKVDLGSRISIDQVAKLAEVPYQKLRNLNAGLRRGITPPTGPHRLVIPLTQVSTLRSNLEANKRKNLFSVPGTHVVAAGDSVSSIAAHYGIKQAELRELNRLKTDKILVGQKLAVQINSTPNYTGSSHQVSYTIQRGDTLSEIAQKFNVRAADITQSSGASVKDNVLIPGKKLRIQVAPDDENG